MDDPGKMEIEEEKVTLTLIQREKTLKYVENHYLPTMYDLYFLGWVRHILDSPYIGGVDWTSWSSVSRWNVLFGTYYEPVGAAMQE